MMRQLTGRRQETAEAIKMATTTEIAKSGGWSAERIILINLINTSHDGRNSLKPSAMAQVGEATTGVDAAAQGAPHAPPPPRAQSAHPVSRSADFFVCPATGPGAHGRWHPRPGPPTAAAMPDELGKIRCVTGRSAPEANLERTYLCSERANCSGTVRCSCTFLWGSRARGSGDLSSFTAGYSLFKTVHHNVLRFQLGIHRTPTITHGGHF
jgi:hypothetical protein